MNSDYQKMDIPLNIQINVFEKKNNKRKHRALCNNMTYFWRLNLSIFSIVFIIIWAFKEIKYIVR